ncbi:MAG: DEAD/DEAH box helicase [Cyclobacteriaceae bacterium]
MDSQIYISTTDGLTLELKSKYSPDLVKAIHRFCHFPKWNGDKKIWELKLNPANMRGLLELPGILIRDESVQDIFTRFSLYNSRLENLHQSKQLEPDFYSVGTFKLKKFQVEGVQYLLNHNRALFWDDMGLGKTVQALTAVEIGNSFPCIVVAPSGLKNTWKDTWHKAFPDRIVQVLGANQTVNCLADVYILSYNKVKDYIVELQATFPISIIVDEAHEIKNFKLGRFKSLRWLSQFMPIRYLLTGTPIMNRPSELLAQLMLIDILDTHFGGFENFIIRYCGAKKTIFGWDYQGASNLTELNERLTSLCALRRTKAQIANDIPSKTIHYHTSRISNEQEYQLEYCNIRQFRDGIDVTQGIAWMNRLRLLSALGKLESFFQWADMVVAGGEKLVVFAYHTEVLLKIKQHFNCQVVDGNMSEKKKIKVVDHFQNSPDEKVLALNLRSGGLGWTLTSSAIVAFLESDWNPKIMEQAGDRVHRIGQLRPVDIFHFIGVDTIDEFMLEILAKKSTKADEVTDDHISVKRELFDLLTQKQIAA